MPTTGHSQGKITALVAVPCYDPGPLFERVLVGLSELSHDFLIVDDGSSLATKQLISRFEPERIIVHSRNLGKGAAIRSALSYAGQYGYSHLVTIDADGQHDPQDVERLLQCATAYPDYIVLGERQMGEVDSHGNGVPKSSRFGRQFSNFWVWVETGQWLADTQTGMRVYPVEKTLALGLRKRRFDFEIEVLAKAGQAGVGMGTVPVTVYYPPRHERVSHFHKLIDNLRLTWVHTQMVARRIFRAIIG